MTRSSIHEILNLKLDSDPMNMNLMLSITPIIEAVEHNNRDQVYKLWSLLGFDISEIDESMWPKDTDPIKTKFEKEIEEYTCLKCMKVSLYYDEVTSDMICYECGLSVHDGNKHQTDGSSKWFKEMEHSHSIKKNIYMRRNNLQSVLRNLQGHIIPLEDDVKDRIFKVCKECKTFKDMRSKLKKANLSKYYRNMNYIMWNVNPEYKSLSLSYDEYKMITVKFIQRVRVFEYENIRASRRNFISYHLGLREVAIELGYSKVLQHLQIPIGSKTVEKQLELWNSLSKKCTENAKLI